MVESWIEAVGVIPAVIIPGATLVQWLTLLKRRRADGVSVITWWLFAVANICLYIYTQKYFELIAVVTFLGTATLNIAIVVTALRFKKTARQPASRNGVTR